MRAGRLALRMTVHALASARWIDSIVLFFCMSLLQNTKVHFSLGASWNWYKQTC
jgi:hypothetical protein